ncbi:hypothetical protein D3C86_1642170 [compost metagenome]
MPDWVARTAWAPRSLACLASALVSATSWALWETCSTFWAICWAVAAVSCTSRAWERAPSAMLATAAASSRAEMLLDWAEWLVDTALEATCWIASDTCWTARSDCSVAWAMFSLEALSFSAFSPTWAASSVRRAIMACCCACMARLLLN